MDGQLVLTPINRARSLGGLLTVHPTLRFFKRENKKVILPVDHQEGGAHQDHVDPSVHDLLVG